MKVRCKNCGDWTNIGKNCRDDRTDIGRAKLGWCANCWRQAMMNQKKDIHSLDVVFGGFGEEYQNLRKL